MDQALILQILGIGELKDENGVRAAYHAKLRTVNPEDDQEGFRRLREAYEAALALLRERDEVKEEREKTPLELWIDRVDAVYRDFRTRGDPEVWEELLGDPLCQDLDTSLDARDALLNYRLDHYLLPRRIWQILDRELQIVSDMESLKERYPADFLNYARFYMEHDYFVDFRRMRLRKGADPAAVDVDGYIRAYQELSESCDQGDWKGALRQVNEICAYGVVYPWEGAEHLRIRAALYRQALQAPELAEDDRERQRQRALLLGEAEELAEEFPDIQYIMAHAGNVEWEFGDHERAYAFWQKAPDNHDARCGVIRYCLENGRDPERAKEMTLALMEESSQEQLSDYLTEANRYLIARYEEALASLPEGAERLETELEIAWCHFQDQHFGEALAVLDRITDVIGREYGRYLPEREGMSFGTSPEENLLYSCYNLRGRLLMAVDRFQEAAPVLEIWLRLILASPDDGSGESKKRLHRKGSAYLLLGWCRHQTGDHEAAAGLLEKGAEAVGSLQEKLSCLNALAEVQLAMNACERAVDTCSRIIGMAHNYYPAYLKRQEAYYRLQRGQQVVDDYHRAVEIHAGYYKPYLLAEKVFFHCRQYQDALDVVERAQDNQVELSDEMKLYRIKSLRNLADSQEKREELLRELQELVSAVDAKNTDLEDISELEYEMGLLYWDNNDYQETLDHLQKAIRQNPSRLQYFMVRGEVYRCAGEYINAMTAYQQAREDYDRTPAWNYGMGCCCQERDREADALEYFIRAAELDGQFRDVNQRVADLYMERFRNCADPGDFRRAIQYMDREVENEESCYTLVHRGLMYMEAMRLEEAIADYEKALTYEPDDWAAFNNIGYCCKHLKQFRKSIEMYERALACLEKTGAKNMLPYSNMADCYEILRDYDSAIECYQKDLEWFPENQSLRTELGKLYRYQGKYREAEQVFKKMADEYNEPFLHLGDICVARGKHMQARFYYQKALQCGIRRIYRRYTDCAERLFCSLGDAGEALKLLRKAEEMYAKRAWGADSESRIQNLMWQAQIHYLQKRGGDAARYAGEALDLILKGCISEEIYVSYPSERPYRLYRAGKCHLYLGHREKALEYFAEAGKGPRCRFCREPECYERFVGVMLLHMAEENWEEALESGEHALEICPNDLELWNMVQRIRKETERR